MKKVELRAHKNTEGGCGVEVFQNSLVVVEQSQRSSRVHLVKVVQTWMGEVVAERGNGEPHDLNMLQVVKDRGRDQQVVERLQDINSMAEVVVWVVAVVCPNRKKEAIKAF